MKITKELLKRHSMGLCNEEEKKAVEEWFRIQDDTSIGLKILDDEEFRPEEKLIWSQLSQAVPELSGNEYTAIIPLNKKLTGYVAVAFIFMAVFFAGRLSVITVSATKTIDKTSKGHLHIFGGNGTRGSLPGDGFRIKFNGTVKLYNGSTDEKNIQVGDTSYVLKPRQIFYLNGSAEAPTLRLYSVQCLGATDRYV